MSGISNLPCGGLDSNKFKLLDVPLKISSGSVGRLSGKTVEIQDSGVGIYYIRSEIPEVTYINGLNYENFQQLVSYGITSNFRYEYILRNEVNAYIICDGKEMFCAFQTPPYESDYNDTTGILVFTKDDVKITKFESLYLDNGRGGSSRKFEIYKIAETK